MKIQASDWYSENNYAHYYRSGFAGWLDAKANILLEKDRRCKFENVLELAATDLNHLGYVKHDFKQYVISDKFTFKIIQKQISNLNRPELLALELDATSLCDLKSDHFDRIISTCLLPHLNENEIKVLISGIAKVLKRGAVADLLVPRQNMLVWNLGRIFFIVPKLVLKQQSIFAYFRFARTDHQTKYKKVLKIVEDSAKRNGLILQVDKWPNNLIFAFYFRITLEKS